MALAIADESASVALVHFGLVVPRRMSSLQALRLAVSAAVTSESESRRSRTLVSRSFQGTLARVGLRGVVVETSSGLTEIQSPFHLRTSKPPLPILMPDRFAPWLKTITSSSSTSFDLDECAPANQASMSRLM
jgi:hypothetical protein